MYTPRRRQSLRSSTRLNFEVLEPRLCLATVPGFESLPGANHTIYLDFDGQVVEGTNWNSYYNQSSLAAQPYNIDSDPNTFSPTELSHIEATFQRVAEDFRAFNVNVTTIEPSIARLQKSGSGDTQWGVRVIVTNESSMVTDPNERCGCGGIAYINSFNSSADLNVWVYTTGNKNIAEAASHEVGHALGLSHDGTASSSYYSGHGTGDTGWASIMGVGYYRNVSQWDNGTYYGSNNTGAGANYGKGADDLAVITTYNGFGFRADDHGNSMAQASPLSQSGTNVQGAGVIEKATDVDVFSFVTGAGSVTLNVDTFLPGPNLDIQADLYNASGTLIATSNPIDGLNASFSLTLAAGQYYLVIDGVGVGNPTSSTPTGYSDYASIGSYKISGTVVNSVAPQFFITDVSVAENAGVATFTVNLTGSISSTVTVDYATGNGSATSPQDYTEQLGKLTFEPGGPISQTIVVNINDDNMVEGTETFVVNLTKPSGAIISDSQGVATIYDNDAGVSIGDASANEGNESKGKKNSGSTNYKDMVFTISLSNPVGHDVSVEWTTMDDSAKLSDLDYEAASGTLIIAKGEISGNVVVRVIGDNTEEPDETFLVKIVSVEGAAITDGEGEGTILNDDGKGGGKGGGPKNGAAEGLLVVDPWWYFGDPADHDNHAENDHDSHSGLNPLVESVAFLLPGFDESQRLISQNPGNPADRLILNSLAAHYDSLDLHFANEGHSEVSFEDYSVHRVANVGDAGTDPLGEIIDAKIGELGLKDQFAILA